MWESVLLIPAVLILGGLVLFSNEMRATCTREDPQARRFFLIISLACLASMLCLVVAAYRMNGVNRAEVSNHP
jgi:hypothetical protein